MKKDGLAMCNAFIIKNKNITLELYIHITILGAGYFSVFPLLFGNSPWASHPPLDLAVLSRGEFQAEHPARALDPLGTVQAVTGRHFLSPELLITVFS